jgi:NAD(P)H dehydrogenase (quinone)
MEEATIDFLLQKGISPSNIAGLAREVSKGVELKSRNVKVKIGDYNDYNSLVEASIEWINFS